MSLSQLNLPKDFLHAVDQTRECELVYPLEVKALRQALESVHEYMQSDSMYSQYEVSLDYQLKFLRQTCNELHIAREEHEPNVSNMQYSLLQSLNNIMEDVQDAKAGIAMVNYHDLYNLSLLSDVLRRDAKICKTEMRRELGGETAHNLHDMLNKTADRFDLAQSRNWNYKELDPSIDLRAASHEKPGKDGAGALSNASNNVQFEQADIA